MGAIRCPALAESSPSTSPPLPSLHHNHHHHRQETSSDKVASTSALKLPPLPHYTSPRQRPSGSNPLPSSSPDMLVSRPQDVPHRVPITSPTKKRGSISAVGTLSVEAPVSNQASSSSSSSSSNAPLSPFNRFRPHSHFMAPKGWMNDPAGPCFDGEKHHMFYESNPKGSTWGNMSWGHATAPTLAGPWTHDCEKGIPVLEPSAPYDCEGIFTGCVVTHGPHGEPNVMTAIYTAVSALPIHWSREYKRGCEKLAMATSRDGGRSWQRDEERNPILPGPPDGIEVKSWRDPFVAVWDYMDETLGQPKGVNYYGLIAGSIPDVGPRLFLYRIPRDDLGSWTFISTLGDVDFNASLPGGPSWTGEFGRNWEVGMFFSLPTALGHADGKDKRKEEQYILLNVEGCDRAEPARHPMWLACDLSKRDEEGKPGLDMRKSGHLDWGCAYAASSFRDSASGRTMMWSWITEDDLPESYYDVQGWSGVMALPRELFQLEIDNVIGSLRTPLEDIGSLTAVKGQDGRYSISTLGMRPGAEVERLRVGATRRCEALKMELKTVAASASPSSSSTMIRRTLPIRSRSWELEATIRLNPATTSKVGFILAHTPDLSQSATVYFEPSLERIVVDRRESTRLDGKIKVSPIEAPFTLFKLQEGADEGEAKLEPLRVRIICDNSVVEIFVNDRLACATRIYPDDALSQGLTFFAEQKRDDVKEGEELVTVERLDLWEGLASAFTPPAAL